MVRFALDENCWRMRRPDRPGQLASAIYGRACQRLASLLQYILAVSRCTSISARLGSQTPASTLSTGVGLFVPKPSTAGTASVAACVACDRPSVDVR